MFVPDHRCFISVAIQDLLTNPNPKSPAQHEAYEAYTKRPEEYNRRVKAQAMKNAPVDSDD